MKNRVKRLFALLLCVLTAACAVPGTGTAEAAGHSHDGMTPWGDKAGEANSLPTAAGSYYLTRDIELSAQQVISSGEVTLCLNDHSITMTQAAPAMKINGGTFNLYDCGTTERKYSIGTDSLAWIGSGDKSFTGGYITHTHGVNDCAVYFSNGTFNMYGGVIIGNVNDNNQSGGAVHFAKGTFNMYGGGIIGNKGGFLPGGGIRKYDGTFNMYGGTICDNTAASGGGIHNVNGNVNICGGEIRDNHSTASNGAGGGIVMQKGGNLTMSGGKITGNSTTNTSGALYIGAAGTVFTFSGGEISGNISGGSCGAGWNCGTMRMSGGSITGNSAAGFYGGLRNSGTFEMSGGSITGNLSSAGVGGLGNTGTMTLTGGEISGNSAPEYGGGLYNGAGRTLNISGSPKVTGNTNTENGKPSNVYLHNEKGESFMTVTGILEGAELGISVFTAPETGTPLVIAKNYKTFEHLRSSVPDPSVYFTSDDPDLDVIAPGSDAVLAARCTLEYDANGGSGTPPAGGRFVHGTEVTVAEPGNLALQGFGFAGWSTEPGGTRSGNFAPGDRFSITGNVRLYSQWKAVHTVTWLNGDGSVLDEQTFLEGEQTPETDKIPTKPEDGQYAYTFSSWTVTTDENGNVTCTPVFTATAKPTAEPTEEPTAKPTAAPAPTTVPKTGDSSDPALYLLMAVLGLAGAGFLMAAKRGKR